MGGRGRRKRSRESTALSSTALHMSVATAPSNAVLDLGAEIRQTQAALLYADSVTLISPRAALIQTVADIENATSMELLELLVAVAPT